MSDDLSNLLQEGSRGDLHDDAVPSDAMYDDLFQTMTADGHIPVDQDSTTEMTGLNVSSIPIQAADATLDTFGSTNNNDASTSIPIPAGLASIASQVKPLKFDLTDPTPNLGFETSHDRGEMGGKRKKAPHERAGWKDMDEKGNMPKRPRGKKGKAAETNTVDGFVGYQPPPTSTSPFPPQAQEATTGTRVESEGVPEKEEGTANGQEQGITEEASHLLVADLADAATREMGLEEGMLADVLRQTEARIREAEGSGTAGQGQTLDPAPSGSRQEEDKSNNKMSNESRAEQNRRAQQVYRRRREERIKDLESQAAALDTTRRALYESFDKMKLIALEYETARIQLSALQATLLSLNNQGVSILTSQYNFPIEVNALKDTETMRLGPIPPSDVQKAFEQLEKQSRALATARIQDQEE